MPKPVEPIWAGSTVVCLASGPSLTQSDVASVRGKARVIAVNNNYQLAPWADALYAADAEWWRWHKGVPTFHGLKFGLAAGAWRREASQQTAHAWGIHVMGCGQPNGLSSDPAVLNHGRNSGYQAIGLAVHFGATRIVLLGYDLQRGRDGRKHWHPDHPGANGFDFVNLRKRYQTLVGPLQARGIDVVNCTRETALEAFPRQSLESVFPVEACAA